MDTERSSSRRRSSAAGSSGSGVRSSALEQLKAIREQGGRRIDSFEVKQDDKIYDTVSEDDYNNIVAQRRAHLKEFVVDDGGLGYADDGEEDDWENVEGRDISSSGEDDVGGNNSVKTKKRKKDSEKAKKDASKNSKKVSSRAAAAALMGKQKVSSMFASASALRKGRDDKKGTALATDSILEDLLAEITPDEADREKRRRQRAAMMFGAPAKGDIQFVNGNQRPNRNQVSQVSAVNLTHEKPTDKSAVLKTPKKAEKVEPKDESAVPWARSPEHKSETVHETCNEVEVNVSTEPEVKNRVLESKIPPSKEDAQSIATDEKLNLKSDNEKDQNEKLGKPENNDFVLNAKIVQNHASVKATEDWQAVWQSKDDNVVMTEDKGDSSSEETNLPLEPDGTLLFYLVDAYEEAFGSNPGTVFLFGKVKHKDSYASCCVLVKNIQRCIFAIPTSSVYPDNVISELEQAVKAGTVEESTMRRKLQELSSGLKHELSEKLLDLNVTSFTMVPVKRNYAFERTDVPTGENYVLKLSYPFKDPPLPANLKGSHFSALFGTHSSALELLLVKRRIRGPTWLSISNTVCCQNSFRVSWCKFEATVTSAKDIKVAPTAYSVLQIPQMLVAAINLKTITNEKTNANEIASVSVVYCRKTKIDYPMPKSEWNKAGMLGHFSVLRKLDGGIFPLGLKTEVLNRNNKAGTIVLNCESSERALLNLFFNKLHQLDPDVLVGHNISGFDLDVILHRAQACKVFSNIWSKIGRLKRSLMPKLSRGSGNFGAGASLGILTCIAGRLLCDTYLSSRELLKEVSYSLTQLSKNQLGRDRKEIAPVDIPEMYRSTSSLLEMVECGETDAWLSLGLMFHLSVLPLTRQLTNVSGNLWSKTLLGARAQRVEYLLLHEFHARKFILPDKMTTQEKDVMAVKRKLGRDAREVEDEAATIVDDIEPATHGKAKKGPAYLGGLVLEPKKGLYDKFVLLLDFNSLYPSIIQEYNICFTTVDRPSDGSIPNLPSCNFAGVLPQLLKNLVSRRRQVKLWLKNTSDPLKYQQLDIQQQALKLTANSMYGCLGFANSRFYAKPLAELTTSQGREILQSTVDLVQNNLNLEVIYGDTDSIMIHTGLDDVSEAKLVAVRVMKEVNKKYKCLEIDLDGIYKRILLLKKKKYAAVKLQFNNNGAYYEVIEQKGLDIVRRDWSLLSKEIGNFCLEKILSGGSCEDVVEAIHSKLQRVQEDMRNGQVELEKYVITKSLTKSPEEYPDAKNQPHVQVALRMKQSGHRIGCSVGDTVAYIICCQQGSGGTSSGIAERARHPEELKRDRADWMIDIDYYLSQQIHPVVTRLCAPIQGTSAGRLADCLGLDSSKFESKTNLEAWTNESAVSFFSNLHDDDERYHDCEPFRIKCPRCSSRFQCPSVTSIINSLEKTLKESGGEPTSFSLLRCSQCQEGGIQTEVHPAVLANQVQRFANSFIEKYYMGLMICDDEMCKYTTRNVNLRVLGDSERGTICPNYPRCNGRLVQQYSEVDLYKQLTYLCRLFDVSRLLQKADSNSLAHSDVVKRVGRMVEDAYAITYQIRDRCGYGWIKMGELVVL